MRIEAYSSFAHGGLAHPEEGGEAHERSSEEVHYFFQGIVGGAREPQAALERCSFECRAGEVQAGWADITRDSTKGSEEREIVDSPKEVGQSSEEQSSQRENQGDPEVTEAWC